MYGLSAFFVGEQRVAAELGPMMRAAPDEDMRLFLCTQIADEARHVAFFDRFYSEVGVLRVRGPRGAPGRDLRAPQPRVRRALRRACSSGASTGSRSSPRTSSALVEAVTIYHMVIEGMLALTGQHFIMDYNERMGTLPGFVKGFTLVARDEHRHVAFGARFLRDMARRDPRHTEAIQRTLAEVAPVADGVLRPKWFDGSDDEPMLFGASVAETRAFALKALERRMKVIGLVAAA